MAGLLSGELALPTRSDTLVASALWWRDHVGAAPEAALNAAESWLSHRRADAELRVVSRHIACLASIQRGRLSEAREHARRGVEVARRARLVKRERQLRLAWAWVELERGAHRESWRQLDLVSAAGDEDELSTVACLRGILRCHGHDHARAVSDLTDAIRSPGQSQWNAGAVLARGVALMRAHALHAAQRDLVEAEELFRAGGEPSQVAVCQHNRGCVALRAGDVGAALRWFATARASGLDSDANPEVLVDRAEALTAAGLGAESQEELRRAAASLELHDRPTRLAETKLALAGCALRNGDLRVARDAAEHAHALFRRQQRPSWGLLAATTMWKARLGAGEQSLWTLWRAHRVATACAERGWHQEAAELCLTAGWTAGRSGHRRWGRRLLMRAARSRRVPDSSPSHRAVGWLAKALLAKRDGNKAHVFDACRAGLRAIGAHAATLGSFELRVHAFGLAAELTETAIGTALSTGDPRLVLRWVERGKACALNQPQSRRPTDSELHRELRRLRFAAENRARAGGSVSNATNVLALEDRVRQHEMVTCGRGSAGITAEKSPRVPWGIEDVVRNVRDAVLVNFFVHNGQMFAISVVDEQVTMRVMGESSVILAEVRRLRHCLAKEAHGYSDRVRAAYSQGARHAAEMVQAWLLSSVLHELGQARPLVVVPTGGLHALPWAQLPACRSRSVTVTPSLRCWLNAAESVHAGRSHGTGRRPTDKGPTEGCRARVWVSGPGLDHAEDEVRALQADSGGHLVTGQRATSDRVLRLIDGADIAHIAAHGTFREDRPQLSSLELADGPLYGYDLDRLHCAPSTVVLSACEVGRSAVRRGDELSGLAAALLGRGTATVISSVVPVPDERTAAVMLALHAELRRGVPPASALARAQAAHDESGFVCLGYGGT